MIRINEAPLKQAVLEASGILSKVWLQWISNIATALTGVWGTAEAGLTGLTSTGPITNKIVHKGSTVHVYLKLDGYTSSNSQVEIKQFKVLNGIVNLANIDNSGNVVSITPLYVEDNKFTVPNGTITNTAVISGELIRNLGE